MLENKKACPYSHLHDDKHSYQSNHFYQKIKTCFVSANILLVLTMLFIAFYSHNPMVLLAWPVIFVALLMIYSYWIGLQFKPLNNSRSFPYCGILTNIYDVLFRSSLLLRDIDVERKLKYGDIYLSFFGLRPVVIVTSANLAEQISKDIVRFAKSDPRDLCMPYFYEWVGNNNIVLANGDKWKETRKLIHPVLNDVQLFVPVMYEKTQYFCDKIDYMISKSNVSDFSSIKLTRWLKALSLDISGEALFGYNFNHLNEETNPGIEATDYVLQEIFSPLRLALPLINHMPIKSNQHLRNSIKLLDELVLKMIDFYLQQLNKNELMEQNVLAMLLQGQHEKSISTHDLRNNILALVLASHETTQVALGGVLYYLAKYPEWQERIREESKILFPDLTAIISELNNVSDIRSSSYWKLKTFENLDNFILESLRHYSPLANQNPRTTLENVELGGYEIPKGTLVIMNLHAIHMNEAEWNRASEFNPDRFKKESKFNKFAYLPFGNGPRICSGREFSLIEQKLAVCMLLRKYEIRLPHDNYQVPIMRYSFTGIPDDSFQLDFKRLSDS